MDRCFQSVFGACATVVMMSAIGCGSSSEAEVDTPVTKQAAKRVEANEEVTVLARSGARTFVQTADGAKGYVPTDRLRIEGSAGVITEASELDVQTTTTEPNVPRPIVEINRERGQLDILYLSADGNREFLRPKSVGPFVDPESGQTCWPAITCLNEVCSGLSAGNSRSAFPGILFHVTVEANGAHKKGDTRPQAGLVCPACGEKERLRPYVLPETSERLKELAEEHRRRLAWVRSQR